MDRIGNLVGDPNFAAVGPEDYRRYSWSFNPVGDWIGRKQGRNVRDSSIPVNPKDGASLAGDDHVKAVCANMIERDPVVVRCGAPEWREVREQRRVARRDPED